MAFQKEYDLAEEKFLGKNLGFTHNVSTNFFACYVCLFSFNGDLKRRKFDKPFEEYNLPNESWSKFRCRIKAAPSWSLFDYEFVAISKKSCNLIVCMFRQENV